MAYQTRSRDPLLDSTTQAVIEKRGKELIGVLLIVLGLAAAAMIGSYSPDDPNWLVSTDAPVQNWLGHFGASLAAPLFMIAGWACWGLPVVLLVWGLRFVLHLGDDRAAARQYLCLLGIFGSPQSRHRSDPELKRVASTLTGDQFSATFREQNDSFFVPQAIQQRADHPCCPWRQTHNLNFTVAPDHAPLDLVTLIEYRQ